MADSFPPRRLRIYTDTSALGGCLDPEFAVGSKRLVRDFSVGHAIAVLSDLTRVELSRAPAAVRRILDQIPERFREYVSLTPEVTALANAYLESGALGRRQQADAAHIAFASSARVDVLVSWNFKHIVNLQKIHMFNGVNVRLGYPVLEIRTPLEVAGDEND